MNEQHAMSSHGRRAGALAALVTGLQLGLLQLSSAAAQVGAVDIQQRLTPEQMHATGLDTLSPAQLQLLNRLLREEPPATNPAPVSSAATAPNSKPVSVEETASNAGSSSTQPATAAAPVAPMFIGLDDQPIKSRIPGSVSGWAPGNEFRLENGQRWKVLKGEVKLPKALENPSITVIPGVAGRWFLQVDESLPSARVYRIE